MSGEQDFWNRHLSSCHSLTPCFTGAPMRSSTSPRASSRRMKRLASARTRRTTCSTSMRSTEGQLGFCVNICRATFTDASRSLFEKDPVYVSE